MEKIRAFLRRKDIVFSAKRYFIDAMGAMAQGLFCTLLVGTILNTIGQQFHIGFLNAVIVTIGKGDGAVEALYAPNRPVLGVQWHPERQSFTHRRRDADDGAPVFRWLGDALTNGGPTLYNEV